MTVPAEPRRPTSAIVSFGAVAFVALTILGFGVVSYVGDTGVIVQPGMGPFPGALGLIAATLAWIGFVAPTVRRLPGLSVALGSALIAAVVHGAVLTACCLGAGLATALDVGSHLVFAGFSAVVAVAALIAATGVAVLARSGGGTAKWPWERVEEE